MKNGDGIPGLVGWEWHGDPADIPGLEVLAQGDAKLGKTKGTYSANHLSRPDGERRFQCSDDLVVGWVDVYPVTRAQPRTGRSQKAPTCVCSESRPIS